MLHWILPATQPCSELIECFWFIEKTTAQQVSFPKLNPDPSAHLILAPLGTPYNYAFDDKVCTGHGCHLLFAHKETAQLDHSKPFLHVGIKLRPSAIYRLALNSANSESLDNVIELNTVLSLGLEESDLNRLFELARHDPLQCVSELENDLALWLANAQHDQHSKLADKVVEALPHTAIADLSAKLYCSQRTIERSFRKVTNLTLKQYQAMIKLELMLEYLYQRPSNEIDWVDVAYQFGFSDQPHLIRYLKKQIGTTPQKYIVQRGFTIDVYGGVTSE
ncbi:helix-turn-helix transcriptional regulator [Vibrio sp. LaRot3]|uniref:helix-turn-helix transcriptional regulator n=1 Tax=Vibrio sp. LaRot3 TaxID=2998829 RepID=UPI0022CDDCDC|nr:helix-turn-helix transcriptional regulator [Vibrio sp. LaRot3]MDA0149039.1 helix-turn-helix transcriptional regulator [Vibrio sp. LaRot3]